MAAADRPNEEQIRKNLNILPPSRLLALYADLRNGSSETLNKLEECTPPSNPPKNNKTKTNKSSVRPLDTNGALKAESFQKKSCRNMFDWQSGEAQASIAPPHPPLSPLTELYADWIEHCGPSSQSCGNRICQHVQST